MFLMRSTFEIQVKFYLRYNGGSDTTVVQFTPTGVKSALNSNSPGKAAGDLNVSMTFDSNTMYDVKFALQGNQLDVYVKGPTDTDYVKIGSTNNVSSNAGGFSITASYLYSIDNVVIKDSNKHGQTVVRGAGPKKLFAVGGDTQVSLTWDPMDDAASYDVYRSTSALGPFVKIDSASTTAYTDKDLLNGLTYYYFVTVGGKTAYSNLGSAMPHGSAVQPTASPIKHTVVIYQENRSFDNYFGTYPYADGFTPLPGTPEVNGIPADSYNLDKNGAKVLPFRLGPEEAITEDVNHSYDAMIAEYDNGAMDNYVLKNNKNVPMGHYDYWAEPSLWQYAQHFSLADNWYQPIFGPSTPGALYLVAAQSGNEGTPLKDDTDPAFQPYTSTISTWQPLTYKNIGDVLSENNISWAWYQDGYADGKNYVPHHNPFQYFEQYANGDYADNIKDYSELDKDIDNGTLPTVVYVKAGEGDDEHPGSSGPTASSFSLKTINKIMSSPYWKDTAIILTYDESGGLWDHVPPPQVEPGPDGLQGLGPRIPALVISPYAKKNYVSHVQYDTTSILSFLEWNYHLQSLNNRDANADNMIDLFDFDHPDFTPYIFREDGGQPSSTFGTPVDVKLNNDVIAVSGKNGDSFKDGNGQIMVPLKALARNLNADYLIDGSQIMMIFDQSELDFTLNSAQALIDGNPLKLKDAIWKSPQNEPYISLQAIAQLPGLTVDTTSATPTIKTQ